MLGRNNGHLVLHPLCQIVNIILYNSSKDFTVNLLQQRDQANLQAYILDSFIPAKIDDVVVNGREWCPPRLRTLGAR